MSYMLDTNICIYMMGRPTGPLAENANRHGSELGLSSVSLADLRYGAEFSSRPAENHRSLDRFIEPFAILDFDALAAAEFGRIRAHLRRAGAPVGPYDMLIAAHALSRDMTLVTNNRREFDRIAGLRVENWTE